MVARKLIWRFFYVVLQIFVPVESDRSKGLRRAEDILPMQPNGLKRRPGPSGKGTNVTVSLFLVHIQGIDEKNGFASVTFYIELQWHDPRLEWIWAFENFNGSECVFVPSDNIWTPNDVGFGYNVISASEPSAVSDLAHVCYDGKVTTNKLQRFSFSAVFDNQQFPFDSQQIGIFYGHPFAGIQEIDIHTNIKSMEDYKEFNWAHTPNAEWALMEINCTRVVYEYPKSKAYKIYPLINCVIDIERNAGQYVIFFCIPSVVVTFVGLLGIFCGSNNTKDAKVQLALMNLMALSVLSLSLSESMPSSHNVSRMHKFYLVQMSVICVGSIASCTMSKVERTKWIARRINLWWVRTVIYSSLNIVLLSSVLMFFFF